VKSTFGKGSSFYTILPNVPQKSQHNHSAKSTKINKKAKQDLPNILVIEDDPNDIVFLNDVLSRAEFNVTIAKNGKEAIARCTQKKFDAMTLDLILPDVSGFEILRSIRASVVNQSTPVIVVSVIAEKSISHAFTVHDFLTKPIPQNELIESLGRAGIYPHQEKVILVVDDDPMALKLIDQSLRSHEFNVVTKLAAAEGLAYIDDHQVDIIILDFLMPKMNGFEFLQELKKLPHGEDLPVIIWTNKDLSVNEKLLLYQQSKAIVQKGEKSIEALLSEINYHIFHTAQATRQKKEG
jgi:CheY-like chemotaxis protein